MCHSIATHHFVSSVFVHWFLYEDFEDGFIGMSFDGQKTCHHRPVDNLGWHGFCHEACG